ncbi:MAG: Rpn family recombination-promoting nuclease/putative transposase [Methylococcales bacterium]|nr:Rpn family recombination-promoting nuclease/putative transposase [Methylococcales bacterium]
MKFADPTNDIAFKKIFGDRNKKEILISFLNAILGFEGRQTITNIVIVNPYQVPKIEQLKETILDIKATNQAGENFIVEMQKKDLGDFTKRTLYYTSKAYVEQLNKGDKYSKLRKVYFIGLVKFNIFSNKNYISRHLILNKETLSQDFDDFEFTFLELKKFNKSLDQLETILDKWIYFLKYAEKLDFIPKELEGISEIKEAFQIAIQHKWDREELEVYDYIGLKEYDEIHEIETAIKKGIKKGIKSNSIDIAIKMLKNKMDINIVMELTNLSQKEIEDLKTI